MKIFSRLSLLQWWKRGVFKKFVVTWDSRMTIWQPRYHACQHTYWEEKRTRLLEASQGLVAKAWQPNAKEVCQTSQNYSTPSSKKTDSSFILQTNFSFETNYSLVWIKLWKMKHTWTEKHASKNVFIQVWYLCCAAIWLQDIILVCLQSWNLGITKFQWIFLWSRKVHDHQLFWRLLLQTVPESFGGRRSSIWSYLQISYVLLNPDYCSYLCRNFNNHLIRIKKDFGKQRKGSNQSKHKNGHKIEVWG